jgi:twinkle protein
MYEFKKEDIYLFKNAIGNPPSKEKGYEMVFGLCPYCHGGSKRDKNTFSINTRTGQFECKRSTCGVKGNMITLSRDFNFSISDELDRYYNRNDYNNRFKSFREAHIEVKSGAIEYLKVRGISEAICRKYEITIRKDTEHILVFPFKNEEGELKFIKYRNMDFKKGVTPGHKEWCEADCMPILFGMNQCEDFTTLVITEGQIDSLTVAEVGIKNAVSVPMGCNGFTWIPHCWDWFTKFEELIIFGDCENEKITLSEILSKRFPNKVRIVREEDYKGCKDANEILQKYGRQAVIDAIHNAEVIPVSRIKRLSEVEAVDILNSEAISTGIEEIDKTLSGGLHLGQVILLTGKRGDGKSTFMSQLICDATEQKYNSFIYSGELMDFYFKRWIDMQFAGKSKLRPTEIDALNAWYHDKIFLYDNNAIDDEEETEKLLDIVEKAIQRYDTKLICLDNLMTAIDVGMNEDLYRAQSKFVGKLAKIAKKYNVVVILVAHPRKSKDGFTNDDVSGSADITNKVDVVMSYCRIAGGEENERQLKITKNRLTGKLTSEKNDIRLFYAEDSKRIVGADRNFSKIYGWRKSNGGFIEVKEDEEVPFV